MKEDLFKLLALQQIDIEIDKRRQALAALDSGATLQVEVERLTAELAQATSSRKDVEKDYFDRELALKGNEAKKKKDEDRMYSGKTSNLKELDDLQREVAALTKEIDHISTQVLELMDELETRRKVEKELSDALQQAQKRLEETRANYQAESVRFKSELVELQPQRQAAAEQVPQPLLRRYEQMQARTGVLVAVAMTNSVCAGCHVTLNSQLMKAVKAAQTTPLCESCGRILVWAVREEDDES